MNTVRSIQNDTIDLICWRYYGRSLGVVEKVLEANPKLANIGAILPIGTEVTLPDLSAPQQITQTIQLWD
ncbi:MULTISPECIES: tail protein X [Acinetobacter]|uniref:Phage Tail Protein X family protein n=1 Tax=Acinetobacter baumannii 625974 TaxID=1310607 RepID=A0A009QNP1_ACIBA|nr:MULTISPECIES: tail protein X [Acinetobacter]EKT7958606.1 tail protein X [Acinetobacter baumannii]EKT8316684.1 tail protein X [Acinetobacter baumannii]EKU0425585.1 tail protein X [Acinetobacter baumannii]EKU0941520.1 tail protein X [Acinetobacter baumannii]EKU4658172.1 tail protein X [Acinetobacter baumannii]